MPSFHLPSLHCASVFPPMKWDSSFNVHDGGAPFLRCGVNPPTAPGPLEALRFWGGLSERVGTSRTAGAAHGEGRVVVMGSQGMPALLCLVKTGKLRPRGAGPPDPRFLLLSIQSGGPGSVPHPAQSPLSCYVSRWGRGQPAWSDREMLDQVPQGHNWGWEPALGLRGDGGGPGFLAASPLSVCVQGRVSTGPSVGSHAPLHLWSPAPPRRPPVRMSDGCAPPQAPGPRPGSRSLAADTVCFPAGDAHPVTGHFSWRLPPPLGLPGGPGCQAGPAFGSQRDGRTAPGPTLTCPP